MYAFINKKIGIIHYDLYKKEEKLEYLEKGLEYHQEALKIFSIENYPDEYADIHYNLNHYKNLKK